MSRTSPFFIPQKEINIIDSMNEELIDEIVGQSVDIYKVSIDNTDENEYGESTTNIMRLVLELIVYFYLMTQK